MQEQEKIPHLLDKLDLARFQLKDYRNFDDCEYRAPGQTSKSGGKTFEVIYTHTFTQDLLITHLDIEFSDRETFAQLFEMGEIQASKLTNRGMVGPVIRSKAPKSSREEKSLTVSCVSITQSLKVSLLLKKEFSVLFNDALSLKKQKSRQASEENVSKMVSHTIRAINICGYQLSTNTAASELVPLLNISQAFKHLNRFDEAAETDILVSLSLTSARRFVQAAQSLRTASKFYVEKYITSKSSMDFTRIDKSWFKEENREQLQISGFSKTFASGRVLEGGRYLYKAAKIELLLADTINQPTLLGEKLEAFNRANSFANGNSSPNKIQTRIDYEQIIYEIGPTIIPFLVKVLTDKAEIYKISALKSIEFFYQTLGCTLGNFLPLILKTLISTYPTQREREQSAIKTQENLVERFQTTSRTKLLLDHTNHLLESLLSLLPGMNKKCLKIMFEEIIQTSISEEYRNELRLYVLRFGERIIQLCSSDLEIGVAYLRQMFSISEGKYTIKSDINKHINHNLVFFSQRVIDLLKSKILRHYNKLNCLTAITNWVNDTLIALCESETVTSQPALLHALDLVIAIYTNPKIPLSHPIEPVIYLLNTSLHQPKLPFDKILEAFIVLVRNSSRHDSSSELASEIIERVLSRSKMSTLGLKQLRTLQKVLEIVRQVKTVWLWEFLECIPHSNFDEIYAIFDQLIAKSIETLDKPLVSAIINTLFNQYTVKGKAHQQSKQLFVSSLLKQFKGSLELLLELCLFENPEPQIKDYLSRKAGEKDHGFDSKQFKLHSELFGQKINLLLLVVNKNEAMIDKLKELFTPSMIQRLYVCSRQILLQSRNFKIKSKFLILIKHLTLLVGQFPDSQEAIKGKIFFGRAILEVLRTFINQYKDSKLQYNAVLDIGLIFQKLATIKYVAKDNNYESLQEMDRGIDSKFSLDFPLPFTIESFVGHELMKMWNNLTVLLNSPLENVREMLMLVLIHTFKSGLSNIEYKLRVQLIDQFKPLLGNSLQSNDHSERIMGVRLLALLIGLGKRYRDRSEMVKEIQVNIKPFRQFLQIIIVLEDDWNEDIAHCSRLVSQLCISRDLRMKLLLKIKNGKKYTSYFDTSNISFNLQEEIVFEKKQQPSFDILNNFDAILKADEQFNVEDSLELPEISPEIEKELNQFRLQIEKINFNMLDTFGQRDSFVEEEQYYDPNEERHSDNENELSNRSDEDQLEFEDLGIIDVDDEEWGEEENQVRITQKLPLKKVYKLSPNLASSTKHHRLRNKRMNPAEFEEDKIIVDELEGRINSPPHQAHNPQPKIQQIGGPLNFVREEMVHPEFEEAERRNSLSDDLIVVSQPKVKKEKKTVKKRKTSTTR